MEAVDFNETDQPSMLLSSRVTLGGRFIEVSHMLMVMWINTATNAFKPHATLLLDPMTHVYYDDC